MAQSLVGRAAAPFFYPLDTEEREGWVILCGAISLQYELEVSSRTVAAYAQPSIIRPRIGPDNMWMMVVPELNDFAEAIRAGRRVSITTRAVRRVLQVLDTIVEFGQLGVSVPPVNFGVREGKEAPDATKTPVSVSRR